MENVHVKEEECPQPTKKRRTTKDSQKGGISNLRGEAEKKVREAIVELSKKIVALENTVRESGEQHNETINRITTKIIDHSFKMVEAMTRGKS